MPVRSNIFQRLVAEIHRGLSTDCTISESRFLRDTTTGEDREVDVVVEVQLGDCPFLLGVEVCDQRRAADVGWVERMIQKHEDLPTDRLVLWSASGFTEAASIKARAHGAYTVTPGEAADVAWARIATDIVDGWMQLVDASNVVVKIDVVLPDGRAACWTPKPEILLKELGGDRCQTIAGLIAYFLSQTDVRTLMLDHAADGSDSHRIKCPLPFTCVVDGMEEIVGSLNHVVVAIDTYSETARPDTRSAFHQGTVTTLSETRYSNRVLKVVIRESAPEA